MWFSGILWMKNKKNFFSKRVMTQGCSLECLQWLMFEELTSPLLQNNGVSIKLEHKYFRGEKQIEDYTIDGYTTINGVEHFYEYLGCYFHRNCPFSDCKYSGKGIDNIWDFKKEFLQKRGILHIMRGCSWTKEKKRLHLKTFPTPDFPQIMSSIGKETEIIQGIASNELFGFAVLDVHCPSPVYESIKWLNFPPIIKRGLITEEMLSPYMTKRCKARNYKLPQKTLIQTFNAKQILLYTPMIRFYLKLGLEISNISQFIQYRPAEVFDDFVDKITTGRIQAKANGNESLESAYKVIGNSGYGKMGENVEKYTQTRLGDDKRFKFASRSALFKSANILTKENGEHDLIEIDSRPRKVKDDKPVIMAKAILQNSKLHFLRFVYEVLWVHFIPGSIVLNYADTDSLCISKFKLY
jgi:hypothetical protein